MRTLRAVLTFLVAALPAACGPTIPKEPTAVPEEGPSEGKGGASAGAPREVAVAGDDAETPREAPRPDVAREPAVDSSDPCGAQAPPPRVRKAGSLVVESPPRAVTRTIPSRLRTHADGSLVANSQRVWVGPDVPSFVQLGAGTLELFLMDPVSVEPSSTKNDGFLAFYRDPYGASSCKLSGSENCAYGATLYHCSGKLLWVLSLGQFLSKPERLEVQDIRYFDGVLYFNEACQSYSKESGGKCSSIVAVDPVAKKVLWRSPPLTSNNVFLPLNRYLVSGYGFTAEPDFLFVVRRSDGAVVHRTSIPSAHDGMSIEGDVLTVSIYGQKPLRYRLEGFDGEKPKLVKLPAQ